MLNLLAQTYTTYTYTTDPTTSTATNASLAAISLIVLLVSLVLAVFIIACFWKVFTKAGEKGWKSLIPVYNLWTLAEISGKPGWLGLAAALCGIFSVLPIIGWFLSIGALVIYVLIYIGLAKSFGKSTGFTVLLILLPIIGLPILAFGDAKYVGPRYTATGGATPSKPAAPKA